MMKNFLNRKKVAVLLIVLSVGMVASFCLLRAKGGCEASLNVHFVCPSGKVSVIMGELNDDAFPAHVLAVYRRNVVDIQTADDVVCAAVVKPKLVRQSYRQAKWDAEVRLSARADSLKFADAVLQACRQCVCDFVHAQNRGFEERSLAQQKGWIRRLENQMKAGGDNASIVAAYSNEVKQLECSRRIVAENFIVMDICDGNR